MGKCASRPFNPLDYEAFLAEFEAAVRWLGKFVEAERNVWAAWLDDLRRYGADFREQGGARLRGNAEAEFIASYVEAEQLSYIYRAFGQLPNAGMRQRLELLAGAAPKAEAARVNILELSTAAMLKNLDFELFFDDAGEPGIITQDVSVIAVEFMQAVDAKSLVNSASESFTRVTRRVATAEACVGGVVVISIDPLLDRVFKPLKRERLRIDVIAATEKIANEIQQGLRERNLHGDVIGVILQYRYVTAGAGGWFPDIERGNLLIDMIGRENKLFPYSYHVINGIFGML